MKVGSLFAGYGGLDLAVEQFFGARTVWQSEIDPAASKILAARWPNIPNLGDVTTVDWSAVEPVDIICGGSPCQDVSSAGRRAGMRAGTRSGLWAAMVDAIDALRPQFVVWENVRGVTSAEADSALEQCTGCMGDTGDRGPVLRALGRVLGDLADLGYDARWCGLRAADVGAPHGRFRIFIVATDTRGIGWNRGACVERGGRTPAVGGETCSDAGDAGRLAAADAADLGHERGWRARDGRHGPADGRAVADADNTRPQGREPAAGRHMSAWGAPANAPRDGRDERRPEPARIERGPHAAERGAVAPDADSDGLGRVAGAPDRRDTLRLDERHDADRCGADPATDARSERLAQLTGGAPTQETRTGSRDLAADHRRERPAVNWGAYSAAIHRWERTLGRVAPAPTETAPKGGQRLSPRFVEWMMGLPDGWVTDAPISRNDMLKALGNGVVPQQAYEALRRLSDASEAVA